MKGNTYNGLSLLYEVNDPAQHRFSLYKLHHCLLLLPGMCCIFTTRYPVLLEADFLTEMI